MLLTIASLDGLTIRPIYPHGPLRIDRLMTGEPTAIGYRSSHSARERTL